MYIQSLRGINKSKDAKIILTTIFTWMDLSINEWLQSKRWLKYGWVTYIIDDWTRINSQTKRWTDRQTAPTPVKILKKINYIATPSFVVATCSS